MTRNKYLSRCDLTSKFNISNVYNYPYIKKVVVELFLSDLDSSFQIGYELKSFFFLYVMSGINPTIKYSSANLEILTKTNKNKNFCYVNKVFLENKKNIDTFINFLFIENDFKSQANHYKLKTPANLDSTSFYIDVHLSIFKEFAELLGSHVQDISTKDTCIRINFVLKADSKIKGKYVKNIFPFWYFG